MRLRNKEVSQESTERDMFWDQNYSTAGRAMPCKWLTWVWSPVPLIVPQAPPGVIFEHRTLSKSWAQLGVTLLAKRGEKGKERERDMCSRENMDLKEQIWIPVCCYCLFLSCWQHKTVHMTYSWPYD